MSTSATSSRSFLGDNVWQGYVSAVACLLLSLLLLMSILALAMVTLGHLRRVEPTQEVSPTSSSGMDIVDPLRGNPQVVPQKGFSRADVENVGAQWELKFSLDAVKINPQDYSEIAQKIDLHQKPAAIKWLLWTIADPQSQSSQRLSYLRLMSVRELMINQGAPAESIDIEIRRDPSRSFVGLDATVFVSRLRASDAAKMRGRNGRP